MAASLIVSVIMLAVQASPTASAPAGLPGITADAYVYDHGNRAQLLLELVGQGERVEHVGPGQSGDVRSVLVRSEAGVTTVLLPETAGVSRPEMCRIFVPASYRAALLRQEPEATTAAKAALEWCLNRVSPLIIQIPTLSEPRDSAD